VDFVVIGLGLSALALLTGLTLLCMVAPRWSRKSRAVQPADAAYARAQAGHRRALGQGFLCVGAVLLLATLGGISAGLTDKAGAYVLAAMTTIAALGLFGWDLLYRRQHPVPQRRRAAPARAQTVAAEPTTSLSAESPTGSPAATTPTARRRVLPVRHPAAPARQSAPAAVATAEITVDDDHVPEGPETPSAVQAHETEIAEPPVAASTEAGPEPVDHEPAAATEATGDPLPDQNEEAVKEEPVAAEPDEVATELPEPVPFPSTQTNGATGPAAAPASGAEPEFAHDGDDRVIALFPTAAARRSRMIVAPADPDGKS
jgi:hypothetical protein